MMKKYEEALPRMPCIRLL